MPATPIPTRVPSSIAGSPARARAARRSAATRIVPPRHRRASLTPPTRRRSDPKKHAPVQNRIGVLLVHVPFLSIRGRARLAADAGVSRSTVSRLVAGGISPSYRLARAVTDALEKRMGRPLDVREVFSTDGNYPTPSGCRLCGCDGCLPEEAWGEDSALKPEWRDARPGDWSLARPSDTGKGAL